MTDPLRSRLRRLSSPLSSTPLHPQWLVSRQHRGRSRWIAQRALGNVLDIGCADKSIRSSLLSCTSYCGLDYPCTANLLYGTRPDVFGDARRLPFADGTFDTVLILDVLEHVAEPELALAEARRVLRNEGTLLITVPFAYPMHDQPHDYHRFTEHGLSHRLKSAGLKVSSIREVGNPVEAAASIACIALAQGGIDALAARNWRLVWLPALPLVVLAANLAGWLFSLMLPAIGLMPGAYYVEARSV